MPIPQSPQRIAAQADGSLNGVLRDYMDATRRLQQTHETLQREVQRLRRELESKDRELERRRRLAALGELAAGVAHEVRNPLGAIQLYCGLLRRECGAFAPALRLIDKIERGIRAIEGVVQDTLALVPRRAKLSCHRLRDIVEHACEVCLNTLQAHRVRVETRYADPQACVLADEGPLQRVLVNLLVNAAEAAPGGSRITLVSSGPLDGTVELRVADEGPGLASETIDRIFDPFFTTKPHGTGLGLTIAHRLIETLGGRLTAGNRPGGGAEFLIALPAADPARLDAAAHRETHVGAA